MNTHSNGLYGTLYITLIKKRLSYVWSQLRQLSTNELLTLKTGWNQRKEFTLKDAAHKTSKLRIKKKCYNIGSWTQCCYKFYGRNLRTLVVSKSVCPQQAFPAYSRVCGKGQEPTLEWSTLKVLSPGRLWSFSQTLVKAGKVW